MIGLNQLPVDSLTYHALHTFRVNSDPDTLPRTQNFGVDYIAFSELCPSVPPEFLKLAFTCVSIDPVSRPR